MLCFPPIQSGGQTGGGCGCKQEGARLDPKQAGAPSLLSWLSDGLAGRLSVRGCQQARQLRLSADATARFPAERSMSRLDRELDATRPGDLTRRCHRLSRPGRISSAAVFAPLLSPHLIPDIVTTVAVCLTAKNHGLSLTHTHARTRTHAHTTHTHTHTDKRRCRPLSNQRRVLPGGEAAPLRSDRRSSPLRAARQTMKALSAQARVVNTE